MIHDYFKLALSNLMHRKLRSWLTLIGIFIGIAAVVGLISLGQGLEQALTGEFLELGADKILITAKSAGFGPQANQGTSNTLRERDIRTVEDTPGIAHIARYWERSAKATWSKDEVHYTSVLGASSDADDRKVFEDFFTVHILDGRTLEEGDTRKVVIGYSLAQADEYDRPLHLGDKVTINETVFAVVGIYDKTGDPHTDGGFYVSDAGMEELFDIEDMVDALIVQVERGADIDAVADELTQSLRHARNLDEGDEDFEVQTPKELLSTFNTIFAIVQFVIIGIAAISLVVGGIGIMNTMYTAVVERTQEIGIMKAIGATNKAIMLLFLLESGLLGLVGGIIGVLAGFGMAKLAEYAGRVVFDTLLLQAWFSWWLVLGALLFAFLAGVVSGVFPARQASRQPAVESLRYE